MSASQIQISSNFFRVTSILYNMDVPGKQLSKSKCLNEPFKMQLPLLKVHLAQVSNAWYAHLVCPNFTFIIGYSRFPTCIHTLSEQLTSHTTQSMITLKL